MTITMTSHEEATRSVKKKAKVRASDVEYPDLKSFPIGAIVRIRLWNFVTYEFVDCKPGPYLNMVIGPNGTGKSTIVCAIALGLGGKPELLGRAKDIKDFVKKGKDKAVIEIVVRNETGTTSIQRSLESKKNTSSWRLNGENSSLDVVKKVIKGLNIQVDNLCQFLPQDKVSEFAQMNPSQLLLETQRAAGQPELIQYQGNLASMQAELKSIQSSLSGDEKELESLAQKVAALQEQVERMKERKRQLDLVRLLRIACAWTEYESARDSYSQIKSQKEEITLAKDACLAQLEPLQKRVDEYKAKKLAADKQSKAAKEEHGALIGKLKKVYRDIESLENAIKDCDKEMAETTRGVARRKDDLSKCEKDREMLVTKIAELKEQLTRDGLLDGDGEDENSVSERSLEKQSELNEINRLLEENKKKIRQLENETVGKSEQITLISEDGKVTQSELSRAKQGLRNLQNISTQKLEAMRRLNGDTAKAVEYLRQNRDNIRFEKEIFEPIGLEVSPKIPEFASALEAALGNSNLRMFVVQTKNDYRMLTDLLYEKLHLRCNIMHYDGDSLEFRLDKETAVSYGFDGFLSEFVDGPDLVIQAICFQFGLHQIPIAMRDNKTNYRRATEDNKISMYISGNSIFNVKRGYGSTSTSSRQLSEPKILKLSVDQSKVAELEQRIKSFEDTLNELMHKRSVVEREKAELSVKVNELKAERNELSERKAEITSRRSKYDKYVNLLVKTENMATGHKLFIESEGKRLAVLVRKKTNLIRKRMAAVKQQADIQIEGAGLFSAINVAIMDSLHMDSALQKAELAKNIGNDQNKEILNIFAEVKLKYETAKAKAKRLLAAAKEQTKDDTHRMELEELRAGKNLDQLRDMLQEAQTRADLLGSENEVAIEDYERRLMELEKSKAKVEARRQTAQALENDMEQIRQKWVPKLNDIVERISEAFSKSFEAIGCAGEVKLKQEEDYDKWGITIYVKFRENERLQSLTAHRQSGGERSVSTIIYLMSLQALSKSPFRVVDEINQGMDPRNERMVHSQMVDVACMEGNSQYFLITPKLLPDLSYHRKMKVLVIYNGHRQPKKFDLKACIAAKKAILA